MNNQLIRKEDLSIFDRIKAFFTKLFNKKKPEEIVTELVEENKEKQSNEFEKNIKVDISDINTKEKDLKEFIKTIEDNPEIIEKLSNDRLDKLIKYYEDITNAKKKRIEELKAIINSQ